MKPYDTFTTIPYTDVIYSKEIKVGQVIDYGTEYGVVVFESGSGYGKGVRVRNFRSGRLVNKLPLVVTVVGKDAK